MKRSRGQNVVMGMRRLRAVGLERAGLESRLNYSTTELKRLAVEMFDQGREIPAIAEAALVPQSTVTEWIDEAAELSELVQEDRKRRGDTPVNE